MNAMHPKQAVFRRATLVAAIGLAALLQTPGNAGAQWAHGHGQHHLHPHPYPFAPGIVPG
jgi:hypothetical protein